MKMFQRFHPLTWRLLLPGKVEYWLVWRWLLPLPYGRKGWNKCWGGPAPADARTPVDHVPPRGPYLGVLRPWPVPGVSGTGAVHPVVVAMGRRAMEGAAVTCTCGHDRRYHLERCLECLCPKWTDDPSPVETVVNQRWPLLLPPHLAYRPEFVWAEGWEWRRLDDMHARLKPGDTLVDVGAEQGDLSALYASWGVDVAVIEPAPAMWPSIQACFWANGLTPLSTLNAFCSDESRGIALTNVRSWPAAATGGVDLDAGFVRVEERPDLPTVTLDQVTADRRIDAVTMDVEGAELLVLRGAERLLREQRPTVWVSVHECFMEPYSYNVGDLFRFMEQMGYRWTLLDVDHEWHVRFDPNRSRMSIVNTCDRCGGELGQADIGRGMLACQQCGRLDYDDSEER